MARSNIVRSCSALLAATAALLPFGCQPGSELSVCVDSPSPVPTGYITQGEIPSTVKIVGPYTVQGTLESEAAIELLTVGGVQATEKTAGTNFTFWTATLTAADLEANRKPGENKAWIRVLAYDICGGERPTEVDSITVTIGPNPGVPVSNLRLDEEIPGGECYLPADGRASAIITVQADKAFAGTSIALQNSQGTLSEATAVLADDGKNASHTVLFTAKTAGVAILGATGQGEAAKPLQIPVASLPVMPSGPADGIPREKPYSLYVTSTGHLKECRAEATYAADTTVTVAEPDLGVLTGPKSVKSGATDCSKSETVQLEVAFSTNAPDGAAVTVWCTDTFGQENSATVKVAKK